MNVLLPPKGKLCFRPFLFVGWSEKLNRNYRIFSKNIWWEDGERDKEEPIQLWSRSRTSDLKAQTPLRAILGFFLVHDGQLCPVTPPTNHYEFRWFLQADQPEPHLTCTPEAESRIFFSFFRHSERTVAKFRGLSWKCLWKKINWNQLKQKQYKVLIIQL